MQVLGRNCHRRHPMPEAIVAPRAHVSHLADGTAVVDTEPSDDIAAAVAELGLAAFASTDRWSMFFGGVGAAYRSAYGDLHADGDPRREAATRIGDVAGVSR